MAYLSKIKVLDINTANKIAAGEVIERPASIVKELIENSIDANASIINIEINESGLKGISISDNGDGIPAEEVSLAFKRYATSKIDSVEDLANIITYGFRGEALPSIAAVSKVTVMTKTRDAKGGTKYIIEAGKEILNEITACAPGTQIIVKDVFYNVPARKKHMKSLTKEAAYIAHVILSMSLANPKIHFKYTHNNKLIFQSSSSHNLDDTIITLLGNNFFKNLISIEKVDENLGFRLSGYISKPEHTRTNRQNQYTYVNNRWVITPFLNNVISKAYHTLIPSGRYPSVIFNLNVPYDSVDINYHPTKKEIRFDNEKILESFIINSIQQTLRTSKSISTKNSCIISPKNPAAKNSYLQKQFNFNDYEIKENFTIEKKIETSSPFPNLRPLSQIQQSYILALSVQEEGGVYIIDQHAAHERIRYDKIKKELEKKDDACPKSQLLLQPEIIDLTPAERNFLIDSILSLRKTGFIIEHFGDNTFLLRGVPIGVTANNAKALLKDIIDYYITDSLQKNQESLIKMIACKQSITANSRLSIQEMTELLNALAATELPYTCPHGRPTIIHINIEELNKRFYR